MSEPAVAKFELSGTVDVSVPIGRAWSVFADSDRLNRLAGLGYRFEEEPRPDGTVRRRGRSSAFGVERVWEEVGLWFQKPLWIKNERVYDAGPVARATTGLRFRASPTGTQVTWTVALEAREPELLPEVERQGRQAIGPMVAFTMNTARDACEGRVPWADPPPPPLPDAMVAAIVERAAQVKPARVGEALGQLVAHGAPSEVARIRPIALAARVGVSEEEAIAGCLDAVRHGLLELRFEMLCPSCEGGKGVADVVPTSSTDVHCGSCNIRYDGSFPDGVEALFRPVPAIREVDVPVDCVLSPSRTPHVLAREVVESRASKALQFDAEPGGYLIDCVPHRGGAAIEVRPGLDRHEVSVDLTLRGVVPARLEVGPGPVTVHVRTRTRDPVEVTIRTRYRPVEALTAGRLLEVGGGAVPASAVRPGTASEVRRRAVVAVDAPAAGSLAKLLADLPADGRLWEHLSSSCAVTVWEDANAALRAARAAAGRAEFGIAVAVGAVVALTDKDGTTYAGSTIDRACRVMRTVTAGHVATDPESSTDAGFLAALAALGDGASLGDASEDFVIVDFPEALEALRARVAAAQAAAAAAAEGPKVVADRYEIQRPLARGGMGIVYEARDRESGELVVVKTILPEFATDPGYVQRFFNEARMSVTLRHPRIVHVHDYGEDAPTGLLYIAMEKLVGQEMAHHLDEEGPFEPEDLRRIALDVLDGLQYAHERRIVHRDLKPENIFLVKDEDGLDRGKLIDFGIAHPMDEECSFAKAGVLVGTLLYVSPEQVDCVPLDGRSDLYALGLVLWYGAVGRPPFRSKEMADLVLARLKHVPPDPRLVMDDLPEDLGEAIVRATKILPTDRFPDAASMAAALRR